MRQLNQLTYKQFHRMVLQTGQTRILLILVLLSEGQAALLCSNTKFGQIYAISDVFECKEEHYEVIKVKVWKKNIKQYQSAVKSLLIEEKICETYKSFGGGKSEEKDTLLVSWYSDDRYRNHIKKGTCEDEQGRELTNPPFTKDYYCEYSWMRHRTFVTLSCFYQTGSVVAQHGGFMISDLGDVSNCQYQQGFCRNSRGIAFAWSPKQEEKQEWLEVGTFNASKVSENHILLGQLGMSFNLKQMMKEKERRVYDNKAFRLEILSKRGRRATEGEEASSLEMLKAEINRKLQYVVDSFMTPAAQLNSLCKAIELSLRLSKMLAKSNPTQYMRDMLNNSNIIAQATANNFVKVWPCVKVSGVTWRKVSGKCFASIPISYVFNKKVFKGFLEELSGVIYDSSLEVPCSRATPKIFSYENNLYKYQPGHIPTIVNNEAIATLPILPQNKSEVMINLPEEWVFNHSDFENHHLENSIFRNLQDRMEYLEDKTEVNNPHVSARKDKSAILEFLGFEGLGINNVMETLGNWIFRIGSVCGVVALYFLIQRGVVRKKRRIVNRGSDQSSVYESAHTIV